MVMIMLKNVVTLDVETTTKCKGNCFNVDNKLITIQYKVNNEQPIVLFKDDFHLVLDVLKQATIVVGFNLKFDVHWIKRELGFVPTCIWDCQLAEFILSKQENKYPSLEGTCIKYEVGHKLDIVKTEYWNKGIDTDAVPLDILAEYGAQDVEVTYAVMQKQLELLSTTEQSKYKLFRLHCNDLLVLQEMEFNGIVYDEQGSLQQAEGYSETLKHLESKIYEFTDHIPINLNSRDHISVLLYGGTIQVDSRIPIGIYKTGAKTGQTRYKIIANEYKLPRLVEPAKGSALKKEGYFSTDEDSLLSCKPNAVAKKLITWLLERSKIMKLKSTYLEGLPKTIKEMGWNPNMLYSNLNQCVAITGRVSSTKPNSQNFPKDAKKFCITRY